MAVRGNPYEDPEFVARYARARPGPPPDLIDLLVELCGKDPPNLVVDLGCGTGLSTVSWTGRARRVLGIESNPTMLRRARRAPGVEYRHASAQETGVARGSADVVTCSQSFHWMEPRSTTSEVARILCRGGVFAAYDYALPPLIGPRVDPAFARLLRWARLPALPVEKEGHTRQLSRSGRFRWVRKFSVHYVDRGDARRACDLALSIAHVAARVPDGPESRVPAFRAFRTVVERELGATERPFWWEYDVVLAWK